MDNTFKIEKVAVLGTGVMVAQIAAHLTNAKTSVLAVDITQEASEKGIEASVKLKPSAYYNPKTVELITPLNYDDHISQIAECDWIIEVIAERLDWKQDLYSKIQPHLKEDTIITSNTSGISADELISKLEENMAKRFFITHFFNPPRYMKLVEIIVSEKTLWMDEVATILRNAGFDKTPSKVMPKWVMQIMSIFKKDLKFIVPLINKRRDIASTKAKDLLNWEPISAEQSIIDTAKQLQDYNLA